MFLPKMHVKSVGVGAGWAGFALSPLSKCWLPWDRVQIIINLHEF